MTEKRKYSSRDALRLDTQVLSDLESRESSRRQRAIDKCRDLIPHIGAILVALLRGLNDADELVRLHATKGLLQAFPGAEPTHSRLMSDIVESSEPKVRLAAIDQLRIVLPEMLTTLSGLRPDEPSTTGKQPHQFTEDLMQHAGRWIAWTRDRKRILAVTDTFSEAMTKALAAGEPEPYVKKAPGVVPGTARKPLAILEDESPNIMDDIKKVFPNAEAWLNAPNELLGGDKPGDLIGTDREMEVRYLLRGIEDGITT